MKRTYNLSKIMKTAWAIFKKAVKSPITFAEALHRAWLSAKAEPINAERIENAKAAAGITETTNTWYGWKTLGYEVIHGSKAVFQVKVDTPEKGDGKTFVKSFFTASQVAHIEA